VSFCFSHSLFSFFLGAYVAHFVLLCSLELCGNPSLPDELQKNVSGDWNQCQDLLRRIVSYFELARRSATVIVGLGKLKRSQILRTFYIPFEFVLEIACLVCSSHANPKWAPARSAALVK
jgi:hypothetical protein